MADSTDAVPLRLQLECAVREIGMRERVYARRVREGNMTQAQSDHELTCMKAIAATLRGLITEGRS